MVMIHDASEGPPASVEGSGWYAACESGHPYWAGDTRQTYK